MFASRRTRVSLFLLVFFPALLGIVLLFLASKRPQVVPITHQVNAPIAISPDGRYMATVSSGTVDIINVHDFGKERKIFFRTRYPAGSLAYLPDSKSLVVGGSSWPAATNATGGIAVHDTRNGEVLREVTPYGTSGPAMALSADGKIAAGITSRGRILLWDVKTGARIGKLGVVPAPIAQSLAFSGDAKLLVAGYSGAAQNAMLFDVPNRKLLWSAHAPQTSGIFDTTSAAISPDGRTVALGSQNNQIALFDGATGQLLHVGVVPPDPKSTLPSDATRCVAFSPDSKFLASGGWHGVAVWNVSDGTLRRQLPGCGGVAFSADGKKLATGSPVGNGLVTLWKSY